MLIAQSKIRSPMTPRAVKTAALKANSATRIATITGEIRRRYSGQDGRKTKMATSSGVSRTNKAGRDRLMVFATLHRDRTIPKNQFEQTDVQMASERWFQNQVPFA